MPGAKLGPHLARVAKLEWLTHLDLRSNELDGSTVAHLVESLGSVEFLDLSHNDLTSFDASKIEHLSDTLRILYLNSTGVDLAPMTHHVSKLEFLEELVVSHTPVSRGFIEGLRALHRLATLRLNFSDLDDAAGALVGEIRSLRSVGLQGSGVGRRTALALGRLQALTDLTLASPGLTDDALSYISSLKGLENLSISSRVLSDAGSEHLSSLIALRRLSLSAQAVSDVGCEFLANMKHLERVFLNIKSFGVVGSGALSRLTSLQECSVYVKTVSSGLFDALQSSTRIERVSVDADSILPEWLRVLGDLSLLQLRIRSKVGVGDKGAECISAIQSLESLSLSDSGVTARGAEAIGLLRQLRYLDLSRNLIGDEGAREVAKLSELRHLELRGCGIGYRGARELAGLGKLRYLTLERNAIGDLGLQSFQSFQKLEHLDLLGNKITDVGAKSMSLAAYPRLNSLNLPSNAIGDAGAVAISHLKELRRLSLSGNPVGDEGLWALSSLRRLTSLHLTGPMISTSGAQAIERMTSLSSLGLQATNIGPDGARALARLPELQTLNVRGGNIGDMGIYHILGMPRLRNLHAESNGIVEISSSSKTSGLTGLFLSENGIGDSALERLCMEVSFDKLEDLGLSRNRLTDLGLSRIYRLRSLRRLRLEGNRLVHLSTSLCLLGRIQMIALSGNPLTPELTAASADGVKTLKETLRACEVDPGVGASRSDYDLHPAPLGEGGQAKVYRATDLRTHREVAFKEVLDPDDSGATARMKREIQVSLKLHHFNIMPVVSYSSEWKWFAMPVARFSLNQYAGGKSLCDHDILDVTKAVFGALRCAHEAGWVHRDIQPGNVLFVEIDGRGRWVLADWGLVRMPAGRATKPRRTKTGISLGVDGFAAPELSSSPVEAGAPCDFWSLGQLIAWMQCGKWPVRNIPTRVEGVWAEVVSALAQTDASKRPQHDEVQHLLDRVSDKLRA